MARTALPLLCCLALAACTGEPPPTDTGDTGPAPECLEDDACGQNEICEDTVCIIGDRDDSFEGARPIFQVTDLEDPGVRTGLIHEPGDVDHYAYEAAEPGWVRISTITGDDDEGLDTVLSIYRADGALHHVMDEYATGSLRSYDSRMQVWLPTAGTWFIRVEDVSTYYGDATLRGDPSFSYRLAVEPWGSVSEEPDSASDPSVRFDVQNGSTIYPWGVVIEASGDLDWTTAELPWGDAPIEVWAPESIPGSALRPVVEVTDEEGVVHMRMPEVGARGYGSTFASPQGTYTLSVGDLDEGGSTDHWTVLYIRTREQGYGNPREVEPNDLPDQATPLDAETVQDGGLTTDRSFLQGRLTEEGDVDVFRFAALEGGGLRLVCSSDSYGAIGDVQVELHDPEGTLVATFEDGDDLAPDGEAEDLVAGGYTLSFSSQDGTYGPGVYYRCGVYADHP